MIHIYNYFWSFYRQLPPLHGLAAPYNYFVLMKFVMCERDAISIHHTCLQSKSTQAVWLQYFPLWDCLLFILSGCNPSLWWAGNMWVDSAQWVGELTNSTLTYYVCRHNPCSPNICTCTTSISNIYQNSIQH